MPMLREPFAELAGGRGFAGALQSADKPHGRRTRSELRLRFTTEQFGQLVAHDLDYLLIGRELQKDVRAKSLLADVGDEFVRDAEVDVAFQKRLADFAESAVEVLLGQLSLPAQVFERALQLVG